MFYAFTDSKIGRKSLYQCKSQKTLDWLIGWKNRRGRDCRQCTEEEARSIAAEIGDGFWRFDLCIDKGGAVRRMPYRYWHVETD